MYQVIKMYGDWEPWWFLEDWQKDIIEEQRFEHFEDALLIYETEWQVLKEHFSCYKSRQNFLAAFWDENEQRWCDECDEHLQQYHSVMLLEDGKPVSQDRCLTAFEQQNSEPKNLSSCALKQ